MTVLYQGKRLSVERTTVRLPGGKETERVVVRPGDAVAILPLEGKNCYLIRQYRFAVDTYLYEAPAGTMEEGETPDETARRELAEESGLIAGTWIPRGFIYTTPGFTTERIFLFEARDLVLRGDLNLDEDETIEVICLPVEEIRQMVREGQIHDAKTICLIHLCCCPE
jgi:ADP-ribose pyrophosphatase